MEERRSNPSRRKLLKTGRILLSKWASIDCTIRDLNDSGARLEFANPTELPTEFKLKILATDQVVPVELVWQRGLAAGVRFEMSLAASRHNAA